MWVLSKKIIDNTESVALGSVALKRSIGIKKKKTNLFQLINVIKLIRTFQHYTLHLYDRTNNGNLFHDRGVCITYIKHALTVIMFTLLHINYYIKSRQISIPLSHTLSLSFCFSIQQKS